MKIKHDQQEATFKPINLTLTIETEDELKALWSYLFISPNQVNDCLLDCGETWIKATDSLYDLWSTIDDICADRGLLK